MPAKPRPTTLAQNHWASSGLTDEQAQVLHLTPLSPKETAALGPGFLEVESLKIPYFTLDGKVSPFYRVRYLGELPGFAGVVAKPQRYAQPAGTLNDVYLPPLVDWATIAGDPSIPLIITEGEKKAAAGTARGFPTIGLGGVDVWRASKRGMGLLPILEQFNWIKRSVRIVFDSDAAMNPQVVRAQRQLAEALAALGAVVSIVSLPPAMDGSKVGLDDYLLTHNEDNLRTLLQEAPAWDEARRLWEMNEELVYIRNPGFVVERATGEQVSYKDFVLHRYANRSYMEQKASANGTVTLVRKPLAPRWIAWHARAELKCITYAPGKPPIHDGMWNTWRGLGVEPKDGDIEPFIKLLNHLFSGDWAARDWFIKWAAYPLQYPGTKLYQYVAMWGSTQGTGKTLVGYTLKRIYGRNGVEIKDSNLRGDFNEWAENKQFCVGDEVTGSDKRADADKLKGLITQDSIRINKKFLPSYTIPDCINYFFTSNHPDAFFMDTHDRRAFVVDASVEPLPQDFYRDYDRWYKGDGAAALLDYLLHVDLTGFDPAGPALRTAARDDMIQHTRSDVAAWVHGLIEDPAQYLALLGKAAAEKCELFSSQQLLSCYKHHSDSRANNVTAGGIARELRRCGVEQVAHGQPVLTAMGQVRLFAIRNRPYWKTRIRQDAADHFNAYFPAAAVKTAKF